MPDLFISHATADLQMATFIHDHLTRVGISVFLAPVSLQPGQNWPRATLDALRQSPRVLFLASRAACASAWVQQELGGAFVAQKQVITVVWDMPPEQLPGWTQHHQAVNLANKSPTQIQGFFDVLSNDIKSDKLKVLAIAGALAAAILAFSK